MIDLTPLDVRNKRGDFKKLMRGYDPHEVDVFLELAAERLEALVRENLQLRERTQTLQEQVAAQTDREQAVQDALVTAQELRADIRAQSQREAEHVVKEAEAEARRKIAEAEAEVRRMIAESEGEVRSRLRGIERRLDHAGDTIEELERRRVRFLKEFRSLLERELDAVEVEEGRAPFEDRAIDLDLGAGRAAGRDSAARDAAARRSAEVAASAGELDPNEKDANGDTPEAEADVVAPSGPEAATAHRSGAAGPAASAEAGLEASEPTVPPAGEAAAARVDPSTEKPAVGSPAVPARATDEWSETEAAASQGPRATGQRAGRPAEKSAAAHERPPSPPRPSAPPPAVGDQPSTLELELVAGAESGRTKELAPGPFEGVPDLETVLAEAGIEEEPPAAREEISPPPAFKPPPTRRRDDPLILFDPDSKDRKR